MFNLTSKLVEADIVTKPLQHLEDEQSLAGRKAEEQVENILRDVGGVQSCNIFRSLRIPNEMQTGRHEIDLIVLTDHQIYCLEVKNWAGSISAMENNVFWNQKVENKSNKAKYIQHTSPVRELKHKAMCLRNHLSRAGIFLAENVFICKVILVNIKSKINEKIESSSFVVTPNHLSDFAKSFIKPFSSYFIDPLVPYFVRGQFSYSQMDQIRKVFGIVGTWDILELNGGKTLHGDFKGCSEISVNRKDVDMIVFYHQRSEYIAKFWAVLGYSPTTTASLLKRQERFLFGKETFSTISLPFNHVISFRVAGSNVDSKVPLNDINKIILSC